jgi:hypothetical protein
MGLLDVLGRHDAFNSEAPPSSRWWVTCTTAPRRTFAPAARHNPSVIQRVSRFYAEHPQLVQTLGRAAIAIAMNGMARRRRM